MAFRSSVAPVPAIQIPNGRFAALSVRIDHRAQGSRHRLGLFDFTRATIVMIPVTIDFAGVLARIGRHNIVVKATGETADR
ncbi:hypothetical protein [Herbaspirillum sp. CAH-3]|uniref:hypothetical protein n=1 Tax=Herbaspirillum sp. CAH-3 TaxID=2605746 RepID=UPI0012AC7356|nr:hypothetical protein [Herbaspirillum sp. CAH-3]